MISVTVTQIVVSATVQQQIGVGAQVEAAPAIVAQVQANAAAEVEVGLNTVQGPPGPPGTAEWQKTDW
jgi:hypothetical protein